MTTPRLRVGLLATHPIQYYSPWYRALAAEVDLEVFYSHRQTPAAQAAAGFGVSFDWDVPVVDGFKSTFLRNVSRDPNVNRFWGCDTPEIAAIIRDRHFDAFIVHGWSTRSYWQAMTACWRTHTPVLVRGDSHLATPRASWWRALKTPVYRWFIRKFDAYLVVGSRSRAYLQFYGADPARFFAAPHAVDNKFFAVRSAEARTQRSELRQTLGLPADAVVCLFVGKFIDGKEPEAFVEAVVRTAQAVPGVWGLMVGDGPLRGAVEARVDARHAPVRMTGFLNQTEIVRAYAASDFLVVPSLHETWGLTVNEGMACGLPAVVSDAVGCGDDLVIPGVTGDVFSAGHVEALTACLTRMAGDTPYRAKLAEGVASHIAKFDISAAAAGTLQALRDVAALRARREARSRPVSADGVAR